MHHARQVSTPLARRHFFGNAAGIGALAAGLPLLTAAGVDPSPAHVAAGRDPSPDTRGYRVTEHVAAYYRCARL